MTPGSVFPARFTTAEGVRSAALGAILAGGLLGGALLIGAEFTPLFTVSAAGGGGPVKSVGTGSHQSYALVPLALLGAALAFLAWREESHSAVLAIGLLGLIALLIALLGDLPDAGASGVIRSSTGRYLAANATPGVGLYLETLGAVVLLITSVCGLLLLGRRDTAAGGAAGLR
jgi:hypothetical protein